MLNGNQITGKTGFKARKWSGKWETSNWKIFIIAYKGSDLVYYLVRPSCDSLTYIAMVTLSSGINTCRRTQTILYASLHRRICHSNQCL